MIQEASWNTIALRIQADKKLDCCKTDQPKIIYYYGSFDPPHFGHLNAVEEAMKQVNADFAVVVADDRINLWKPFRTAFKLRTKMLEDLFKDKNDILVAGCSSEQVREVLLQSAYVIHLVGSDVFPRYLKDKVLAYQCHYPELIVSFREKGLVKIPKKSNKVKITGFVQTNQGISSTKIRDTLYAHPEWYESKDVKDQLSMLPQTLTAFILEEGLYSEKSRNKLENIFNVIKSNVSEKILIYPLNSGLSGDLNFALYNENKVPVSVVKVFQKKTFKEDLSHSMKARDYLESFSWQWIKVTEFQWSCIHEQFAFLSQSYVDEKDMGSFWKTLTRTSKDTEELKRQAFCIGRSFRELHDSTERTMDLNLLQHHLDELKSKQREFDDKQSEEFLLLLDKYQQNPGSLSSVHGDAAPGNFFVGKDGVVTFIDVGSVSSKGACAQAKGFPGYEYNQFISSLYWFCKIHHADNFFVDDCIESFKMGYAGKNNKPQPFSKEADAFYSFYWKVIKT